MAEIDILGPSDRRRIWSAEEKAALLAEIDAEGGKVRLTDTASSKNDRSRRALLPPPSAVAGVRRNHRHLSVDMIQD